MMTSDDDLIEALKEAEGEARLEQHGRFFYNGIRYVDHPEDCKCSTFSSGRHCWCCGYHELDSGCGCNYSEDLAICKCGYCVKHCHC